MYNYIQWRNQGWAHHQLGIVPHQKYFLVKFENSNNDIQEGSGYATGYIICVQWSAKVPVILVNNPIGCWVFGIGTFVNK